MHTKTPWKIGFKENTISCDGYCIVRTDSPDIAQHIVNCVNSHDALVGALKKIMKLSNRYILDKEIRGAYGKIAEEALKAAGETL